MRHSRQPLPRKHSVALAFAGFLLTCSVSASQVGEPSRTPETARTLDDAQASDPARATESRTGRESTPPDPTQASPSGREPAIAAATPAQASAQHQSASPALTWWIASVVLVFVVALSGLAYYLKRTSSDPRFGETGPYPHEERTDTRRREPRAWAPGHSSAQRSSSPSQLAEDGERVRELRSQIVELQRQNEQLTERLEQEVTDRRTKLEDLTSEQQGRLDAERTRIATLETRGIESYFDEWKEQHFRRDYEEQIERMRAEVAGSPENVRIIGECRVVHEQLLEKARPWFEAMDKWARALRAAASPGATDRQRDAFEKRLREYVQRVDQFVATLDQMTRDAMDRSPVHGTIELTFSDLVWGRSGDLLTGGYRHRLLERLAEMKRSAESAPADWAQLREDVLPLIDEYQGLPLGSGRNEGAIAVDRIGERVLDAWRGARLEEIRVEQGTTAYNPGIHQAVATQPRFDVPDKTILRVERPGFYCDNKVFRRALVVVSSADASRAVQA